MVSAVIVNFNSGAHLERCLLALAQPEVDELVVVDNASVDDSLKRAEEVASGRALFIRNAQNVGPAVARNQGAASTRGDIILFVDPDVVLSPGSVAHLARVLRDAPGVAAPPLFSEAHQRIEYGSTVDLVGYPICIALDRPALAVSASALATTRSLFVGLGGFDDRFFFGAEETDYCWRVLLAGGEIHVLRTGAAYHACGASTPGGYLRGKQIETTAFRLVNRERNSLAMILKCAPAGRLSVMVPSHVAYIAVTAAVLTASGRPRVAAALLGGLAWNARQLPETLRRRRRTPRSGATEARAATRIATALIPLQRVLRYGLPRFVDG